MESYVWCLFFVLGLLVLYQLGVIAQGVQSTAAMTKRLLAHQGIEWETELEPSNRVRELASNAKTGVAAIKAYREETGLGLRKAKAVVDELRAAGRG